MVLLFYNHLLVVERLCCLFQELILVGLEVKLAGKEFELGHLLLEKSQRLVVDGLTGD